MYKILSKKGMKLVRWIFLVLCTKDCQKKKEGKRITKKKRQEDRNEIGAMHFFRWNLLG